MLPLPPPELDAATVFEACSSAARSKKDQEALKRLASTAADAVSEYEGAAVGRSLHTLQHLQHQPGGPPAENKPAAINKALVNGYTSRMVGKQSAGRAYYDELLASAPDGQCLLCGHGVADTLDHQLPKTLYPLLAVAPSNLAPACMYCNGNKRDMAPVDAERQTLNPYFDHEAEQHTWLTARISGPPVVVTFHALPPPAMPLILAARARHHFAELKLATLYASQAAGLIRVESRSLQGLEPRAAQDYLVKRAEEWTAEHRNGWQAALYTALAVNVWFAAEGCQGGQPPAQ
ncbi:hypothetical protein ACFC58_03435 [Kitasatospora purpeofusca]|uniref:hypothetical protein n=1 Tax=Kitasatospora purpeofusca TaxID=67352 RepID=UPI0035DED374